MPRLWELFATCTLFWAQCSMRGAVYTRLTVPGLAADIFGYLVCISPLRTCLSEHAGCDLVFFDGDFCLCRVSYSLRWLLMSNGSCSQMHF